METNLLERLDAGGFWWAELEARMDEQQAYSSLFDCIPSRLVTASVAFVWQLGRWCMCVCGWVCLSITLNVLRDKRYPSNAKHPVICIHQSGAVPGADE